MNESAHPHYDLVIIGGGINGAGIARDAAGRGLKTLLVEKGDLASGTSSASSKLVHGGLRYLEYGQFRLVRESLKERERLLHIAPHIIHPMEFIIPHAPGMRPAWMIQAGLKLYDYLAPRKQLAPSRRVKLASEPVLAAPLASRFSTGFSYADCWVDDARLVLLNAMDAAEHGAEILTRTTCRELKREVQNWWVRLAFADGTERTVGARVVVNAAGPWANEVVQMSVAQVPGKVRLVKGSHIVVPKIHTGHQAYLLQMPDRRIFFLMPFEGDYTLIGTTDIAYEGEPSQVGISQEEIQYLLDGANRYLATPLQRQDIVWSYSGVRALYDDKSTNLSAITRDYVLDLNEDAAPLLSVFGGKITTYRVLAEQAMAKLAHRFPDAPSSPWTEGVPLPGGFIGKRGIEGLEASVKEAYPWLPEAMVKRWLRQYGSCIRKLMEDMTSLEDMGKEIVPGVFECELIYARNQEWARRGNDFLWRRTKLGLHLGETDRQKITDWFANNG